MVPEEEEDGAFLLDLAELLTTCDVLQSHSESHNEFVSDFDAGNTTMDLLQDSTELLVETEALLASYSNSPHTCRANLPSSNFRIPMLHKTEIARREIKSVQAAKRRFKYRTKLQNERQTLKNEQENLSRELTHLLHTRKKVKVFEEKSTSALLWKAIAKRQMENLFVAEEQQNVLKRAVAHRSQMISEFGETMRQRPHAVKSVDNEDQNSSELNADDMALFEDFLQDLDALYARTDDIVEDCCVEESPVIPYRSGLERKKDGDMEYAENLDVLLIPFSFQQTCSTMWKSMVHVQNQAARHHYAGTFDSENTLAVKFHLKCPSIHEEPVHMMVHLVMRRYLEDERMIIVWRALSEGEGKFGGMNSDETGWCVVRPIDMTGKEDSLFRTVMQTFVRFIPINVASSSTCDPQLFTKMVVASVEKDAGDIARMMDSLILDDSQDN